MRKSFFSRFKNKLSEDFGGRYFEVILHEVIIEEPKIVTLLFPFLKIKSSDVIESQIEYPFASRIADVCIKINGKEVGLIEIKFNDKSLDGQIEEYLKFTREKDIFFTYLTLQTPEQKDLSLIKNEEKYANNHHLAHHMLYRKLYEKIVDKKYDRNPVVALFCKYIKENFMVFDSEYINSNDDILQFIMLKGLFVKHNHGFGRKISDKNIMTVPDYWSVLISNIKVIADKFYDEHCSYFNVRPSIDYNFQPKFNIDKVVRKKEEFDENDVIPREYRVGGWFCIWFSAKVQQDNPDNWLSISSGLSFYLDLTKKEVRKYVFAEIYGRGLSTDNYESKLIKKIPTEELFYNDILGSIKASIDKCLKDPENSARFKKTPSFKKQLSNIQSHKN
ncbi:hypothetical protein M899_1052 [Bacteriovorax sp. BSW11_IV]|uniref:hypothetical protein n=1 Tax=Bacteriovorax sp. BSW11_IV TaxID=1353529 RepID=UPI00038A2461|nr:hypothetical protein [Bacteriovorax sp. BSW11_IV]EQC45182.1 hypothetical protein M899_1052 [Bacteriovorax sp. BSW11_IV]